MKQERLNVQMARFHKNIRPRVLNPTFVSLNVFSTIITPIQTSQSRKSFFPSLCLNKEQKFKEIIALETHSMKYGASQIRSSTLQRSKRSLPSLKNYEISSLGPLKKPMNDRTVYEKQSKKYNIITIQAKKYPDSIRIFPKLSLQNNDQYCFKKQIALDLFTYKNMSLNNKRKSEDTLNRKLRLNPELLDSSSKRLTPLRGRQLTNLDSLYGIL